MIVFVLKIQILFKRKSIPTYRMTIYTIQRKQNISKINKFMFRLGTILNHQYCIMLCGLWI